MTSEARMIGYQLLRTGTLVSFRLISEEVLEAPDDGAEFGLRLQLKFNPHPDDEEADQDEAAEDTAEWGAFGFMFALGVLSFAEAKPRNLSGPEYEKKDEFRLTDFIEGLRFVRGTLHFDADYIRGRRIKTAIVVRSDGTITVETIGRGKSALRWLDQMKGKTLMRLVDQ